MLFSELYSAYYNTVAKIITAAFSPDVTQKELEQYVMQEAFSESVLTILPSLKTGKWPLLDDSFTPLLKNKPTMPLTILQKRWLRAVSLDPRIQLLGIEFPDLSDVKPLFTSEDYSIYDRYADGDPYCDEVYKSNFRFILSAIKEKRAVIVTMRNKRSETVKLKLLPTGFEYSVKDDKIRVVASGCRYKLFNLGRILSCEYAKSKKGLSTAQPVDVKKELTLIITDERNSPERVMLHFAHFEKQAERLDNDRYLLRLRYYEPDESEMVIRVLSFGPTVKVSEPESFKELIKKKLKMQKSCGLR